MSAPTLNAALQATTALALAMPRALGCALLLPALGRQHMAGMARTALCLAISLPQACLLWHLLDRQTLSLVRGSALALKETLVGAMLGFLLAAPFWALRGAGTLIDNQRGANAAQQVNPSLQADSSILGELCERALIAYLVEIGVFSLLFDVLAGSYQLWPALAALPLFDTAARAAMAAAFANVMSSAVLYAAPVLLLLLLVEYLMAIGSTVVQGLNVYQAAMPVKAMLALSMLLLCFPALIVVVAGNVEHWWALDALKAFRR
jgi:type III secretion protein T